jgi:hypothetical protein
VTAKGRGLLTGPVLGALVLIASIAGVVGLGWLLDAVGHSSAKAWVYVVATAVAPLPIAVAVTVGQAEPSRDGLVKQFSSNLFGVAITVLTLTSFGLAIWTLLDWLITDTVDLPPPRVLQAVAGLFGCSLLALLPFAFVDDSDRNSGAWP